MDSLSLGVNRKLIPITADEVNDQPDDPDEYEKRRKEDQHSQRLRDDRPGSMNGCAFSQAGVSSQNGEISVDCGALAKIEIASRDRGVSGDGVTWVNGNGAEGNSDVTGYVAMEMDRTERAGDVASRFSLCNGDIGAEAGAIVAAMMALRIGGCGGKNKESG